MPSKSKRLSASTKTAAATPASSRPPPRPSIWSQLDAHQQRAVNFLDVASSAALYFEQGTGKTWITGGWIERIIHDDFTALGIVLLTNIESTWATFLARLGVGVHRSLKEFDAAPTPKILLLHYEAVPAIVSKLRRRHWSLIWYDEAQRLGSRSSLTSRTAAKLSASADKRLLLTGTPMDKDPAALWSQFKFLAPNVLGTRWADFEERFMERLDPPDFSKLRRGSMRWARAVRQFQIAKSKRKFDFNKLDEFIELVRPHALRVTKAVLNLPPLNIVPVPVELYGRQRQMYDEIERDMVASTLRLTAPLRVTQIGKMQQICGGFVIDDDGNAQKVGDAKLRKVRQLREKHAGQPIVVFARYLEEVKAVFRMFDNERAAMLIGAKKKRGIRGRIVDRFQAGGTDVLVSQVRTGGVGIDLFHSNVAIVYSSTYSHIDFDQLISRLHRRGQTRPVTIYVLVAQNTIDEAIDMALRKKRKVTEAVLSQLRRRHHERRQEARPQVHGRQSR